MKDSGHVTYTDVVGFTNLPSDVDGVQESCIGTHGRLLLAHHLRPAFLIFLRLLDPLESLFNGL